VALEGYCAVCLLKKKQWVKGNPAFRVVYQGKTYLFPGEKQKRMFLADPQAYVPALNGDCVVCFAKMHERVPGNIRYGAYHQGKLYFFASQQQKNMFLHNPQPFVNAVLQATAGSSGTRQGGSHARGPAGGASRPAGPAGSGSGSR